MSINAVCLFGLGSGLCLAFFQPGIQELFLKKSLGDQNPTSRYVGQSNYHCRERRISRTPQLRGLQGNFSRPLQLPLKTRLGG